MVASEKPSSSPLERFIGKLEKHSADSGYPFLFEVMQMPYGPEKLVCQHYDRLDAVNDFERLFVNEWIIAHSRLSEVSLTPCFDPLVYTSVAVP